MNMNMNNYEWIMNEVIMNEKMLSGICFKIIQ